MIVTSKEMKQIEKNADSMGLSYYQMMENAGSQAAKYMKQVLHQVDGLVITVFCGKGNNGGDGFVAARYLREMGANVAIILTADAPNAGEAAVMYQKAVQKGIPVLTMDGQCQKVLQLMEHVDVVVDAMYGSGFHGELDDIHKQAASMINNAIAAVFSLDVPSGVGCDTAQVSEGAVMADFTVIFHAMKPVHVMSKAVKNLGRMVVADIGISSRANQDVVQSVTALEAEEVLATIPKKAVDAHKTSTGRLVNFAGSFGMTGAAVLSGMGALRSGAGYLVTVTPKDAYPIVAGQLIQSTFKFLDEEQDVRPILGGASAIAVGCGLGQGENQRKLIRNILETAKCPVVLDADGINNLSRDIMMLKDHTCPVILTPHAGEMASLCKVRAGDVLRNPIGYALEFAKEWNVILVLKGPNTVIATPDGAVSINSTGNPGLAKAGSGDVLTGMIASFLSQGMEPLDAAKAGVCLHGAAADRCAQRLGQAYMQPDDILTDLGEILK